MRSNVDDEEDMDFVPQNEQYVIWLFIPRHGISQVCSQERVCTSIAQEFKVIGSNLDVQFFSCQGLLNEVDAASGPKTFSLLQIDIHVSGKTATQSLNNGLTPGRIPSPSIMSSQDLVAVGTRMTLPWE
jgi:hypothetical protein